MRKLISCVVALVASLGAVAQDGASVSEWLPEFSEAVLNGPFSITFEQVPETEAPRIVYDTKGSYTSKFRAEVKNGVLTITEKAESRRTTVTEVKVCFHNLRKVRISGAAVSIPEPYPTAVLDLAVGGGAALDAALDVTDLLLEVSGRSKAVLTGKARYFTLMASAGKVDAARLEAMSVRVEASNGAEVAVDASERLEARTSTNARINYSGDPAVVRGGAGFTGGEVVKAD